MGTRSFITLATEGGYKGARCHWDGHLEHNGRLLYEHYKDSFDVAMLLGMGDMSRLGKSIGEKTSFDDPAPDQCVFYARDRAEEQKIATTPTLSRMLRYAEHSGAQYFYLFDGHHWQYAELDYQLSSCNENRFGTLKSLEAALAQGGN